MRSLLQGKQEECVRGNKVALTENQPPTRIVALTRSIHSETEIPQGNRPLCPHRGHHHHWVASALWHRHYDARRQSGTRARRETKMSHDRDRTEAHHRNWRRRDDGSWLNGAVVTTSMLHSLWANGIGRAGISRVLRAEAGVGCQT
jgi:hypothetical protein